MAAKKSTSKKSYVVTRKVPGVFESDDGKTVVFHEPGQVVAADDPGVSRALELYPECFRAE